MDQFLPPAPLEGLYGVARNALETATHPVDTPVAHPVDEHAPRVVGGQFREQSVALLALPQLLLGQTEVRNVVDPLFFVELAVGDVGHDPTKQHWSSVVVGD